MAEGGRTDRRMDEQRPTNIPLPLLGDKKSSIAYAFDLADKHLKTLPNYFF